MALHLLQEGKALYVFSESTTCSIEMGAFLQPITLPHLPVESTNCLDLTPARSSITVITSQIVSTLPDFRKDRAVSQRDGLSKESTCCPSLKT